MRVHIIYITFICTARANLSFDRSIHLRDTTVAGIKDELNAFGVTGLYDGGVSNPQTDNDAEPVDETSPSLLAAGDSGDSCKSLDNTRPLERRGCNIFAEPKDPTAPLKDFMNRLQRPPPPNPYWPLPTEFNPCKPGEASVCCELYYQDVDKSWTVALCYILNWFNEVCSVDWQVWCCPMDLFRWGYPTETQGIHCYNPFKHETFSEPAPELDPVRRKGASR